MTRQTDSKFNFLNRSRSKLQYRYGIEAIRASRKQLVLPMERNSQVVNVNEAEQLIAEAVKKISGGLFPLTTVTLQDAVGRILREDLVADREHPPYDRVAMDGVGLSWSQYRRGQKRFLIEGCQAAGAPPQTIKGPENAIEVMTGAVLPDGCDTVVPYEHVKIESGFVELPEGIQRGANVHLRGSDYACGKPLVLGGQLVGSTHVAVAATIGKTNLKVTRWPRIAVISTGDELVSVDQTPKAHQIRQSNPYAIRAILNEFGFNDVEMIHVKDHAGTLEANLNQIFADKEVVILSGGVSEGKFDLIPEALVRCGVKKIFHKIRQKPGKPMWFGMGANRQLVFGLPGNPVSSVICARRYVIPALQLGSGLKPTDHFAKLADKIEFTKSMTYFCPVKIAFAESGELAASVLDMNGSGDLAALVESDGFIQLPQERDKFSEGESHRLFLWKM